MRRIVPNIERKRGKTLFLAKKRGDADSDLVRPAATELSEVTRILSGTLWRRNSWVVTETPISGQDEPDRAEGSVKRTLLFMVEYDTGNEVHRDLMTVNKNSYPPRTILDADQEAVFVFKGQETCDDSYGVVKLLAVSMKVPVRGATKLICEGRVIREMAGSV